MNYVITGSLGHISRPIVEKLVSAGHAVTVITSSEERKAAIEALGAKAAAGSVLDRDFLVRVFTGADAVYTMVPPYLGAADWKKHIAGVGENYAYALQAAGVKKVVNLSSVGAHMPEHCGPVSGLYYVEKALNEVPGLDVLHLRPAFFFYNLLANVGMVKHMGIIGGNYGESTRMVFVEPADIAEVAAGKLLQPDFTGNPVLYIYSDALPVQEVAAELGKAIDKPELPWINFSDEDTRAGMLQAGLSEEVARNYVEMGAAVRSGEMLADFHRQGAVQGKTRLADFARVFAQVYAN